MARLIINLPTGGTHEESFYSPELAQQRAREIEKDGVTITVGHGHTEHFRPEKSKIKVEVTMKKWIGW